LPHHDIIFDLGAAFVFIALGTVLANRLRFSVIPLLIVIGMLVGPHGLEIGGFSLQLIQHDTVIELLSRLGVLFLLFYLGLEFSLSTLIRSGKTIAVGGSIYVGLNFLRGLIFGWLVFGMSVEALVIAGITTVSSSAIVAKLLVENRRTANPETELILGIILYEDIFVALYLSILSGLVLSGAGNITEIVFTTGRAFLFMLLFIAMARLLRRQIDRALNFKSDEVLLIVVFTLVLVVAAISEMIHVAEAIGALLAGLVVAETSQAKRVEHMIVPMRDLFGAMFFFSFGLLVDYREMGGAVVISLIAIAFTIAGNTLVGIIAGRVTGYSRRQATYVGLGIISRGEFAIIIASISLAGNLSPVIQSFTALYVLVLAIVGPVIFKNARRIHERIILPFYVWREKPKVGQNS
jgi:CPA2 family monovalent cation:H+ antiporter-2